MIRFIIGLILVSGAVGGHARDTATFAAAIAWSITGLTLMLSALPKLMQEGEV